MKVLLGASVGLMIAGPIGLMAGAAVPTIWKRARGRPQPEPSTTLILLLLLVEIRGGLSVLAALTGVSAAIPRDVGLRTVSRVAQVSGLLAALPYADDRLRPVVAQLARAQRSGASLSGSLRRMLDAELAADRARRIARARTLPVRLMIPVTLLMLPGLVLFIYAPTLLGMFEDLTGIL